MIRNFDPATFPLTWEERPASTDIHNALNQIKPQSCTKAGT